MRRGRQRRESRYLLLLGKTLDRSRVRHLCTACLVHHGLGGALGLGETTLDGAAREIAEEVRLRGPGDVKWHPNAFAVSDAIFPGGGAPPEFHYVIAQVFGWVAFDAQPEASSDVDAVRWCSLDECDAPGKLGGPVAGSVGAVVMQAEALIEGGIITPAVAVAVEGPDD